MTFEIGAWQGMIKFYVRVPKQYKDVIRERIYSTYTELAIREAEDYIPEKVWFTFGDAIKFLSSWIRYFLKKSPNKPKELRNHLQVHGTEMVLGYHHVLSIKTNQDKDLLGSLLSGMKDLEWHQKISVQIQVRPLDNTWQNQGRKILEKYERSGIRPRKGVNFTNIFGSLGEILTEGLDEELDRQGLGSFKRKTQRKTRLERKEISVASDKLLEAGFETVIRVMAIGHFGKDNKSRVKGITAAFNELDKENRFMREMIYAKKLFFKRAKARRMYLRDRKNILTTSELSSFFLRLPGAELINDFPDVEALVVKEFAPPRDVETEKNVFAKNFYRGKETNIGFKDHDLVRHIALQGITGTGKSEFIKSLLVSVAKQGRGFLLLEPHGKLADEIIQLIPPERRKDVVWFDFFDTHIPGFNFCKVFERKGVSLEDAKEKTRDSVIEIFKNRFSASWSDKNEDFLENAIRTIIEMQEGNIIDAQRLFYDREYRNYAIKKIKDPQLIQFWTTHFREDERGLLPKETQSTVLSVMYKLGKFLNSKRMLRAIAQNDSLDFKEILDNNKILIFRFSKQDMTEDRVSFIGSIVMKLFVDASFTRERKMWDTPYLVAIDEAQNFVDKNTMTILDELRKYGIGLFLMHQRKEQMNKIEGLLDAIYNNVGTTITFTVGQPDAPYFDKIYGPRVDQMDLRKLPSRYGYCQLLVDGRKSDTFNIYSLDRPEVDIATSKESVFEIKKLNREKRMHYKDIDKMLSERINDYKKLDENGQEIEDNFVEDFTEEYKQIEIANNIKNISRDPEKQSNPPFDIKVDLPGSDEFDFDIKINNPIVLTKAGENKKLDNSKVVLDKEVPFLANEKVEDTTHAEEINFDEINISYKPDIRPIEVPNKKITLKDMFEEENLLETKGGTSKPKVEEIKHKGEIKIEFSDECLGIYDDGPNEEEQLEELKNMWNVQKGKEKVTVSTIKKDDSNVDQGESLWNAAKNKELSKRRGN